MTKEWPPTQVKSMPRSIEHCWSCIDIANRQAALSVQILNILKMTTDEGMRDVAEKLWVDADELSEDTTKLLNTWAHNPPSWGHA